MTDGTILIRCDRSELGRHPKKHPRPVVGIARRKGGHWKIERPSARSGSAETRLLLYSEDNLPPGESWLPDAMQYRVRIGCPYCHSSSVFVTARLNTLEPILDEMMGNTRSRECTLAALSAIVSSREAV